MLLLSHIYAATLLFCGIIATDVVQAYDVITLLPENYDELTEGKTLFVRFFTQWCGHSKKMAPDWERLAKEWENDTVGLIAQVDCEQSKKLCDMHGVDKFPTLKYGDPSALDFYNGSRSYNDLLSFSKANLKPLCSPSNIEVCENDQQELIEKYQNLNWEEIQKMIKEEQKKVKQLQKEFDDAVEKLQEDYHKLLKAKDEKIAEIRSQDLRLLQSIQKAKMKGLFRDEL